MFHTHSGPLSQQVHYVLGASKPAVAAAGAGSKSPEDDWSREEVSALKAALRELPSSMDKNERFKAVAAKVGTRSKRECYNKYKALKAKKEAAVASGRAVAGKAHAPSAKPRAKKEPLRTTSSGSLTGKPGPDLSKDQDAAWGDFTSHVRAVAHDAASKPDEPASSLRELVVDDGDEDDAEPGTRSPLTHKTGRGAAAVGWGVTPTSPEHTSPVGQMGGSSRVLRSDLTEEGIDIAGADSSGTWGAASRHSGSRHRRSSPPRGDRVPAASGNTTEITMVDDLESDLAALEGVSTTTGSRVPLAASGGAGSGGFAAEPTVDGGSSGTSPLASFIELPPHMGIRGSAVPAETAMALRTVVFATGTKHFNDAWMKQGWFFTDIENLRYGLVQTMGGPCGPIACVQAVMLRHLLFGELAVSGPEWSNPSDELRDRALLFALRDIIWGCRAGDAPATVVVRGGRKVLSRSSEYRPDGLTERLIRYDISSKAVLQEVLESQMPLLTQRDGFGVTLFVYSCLLSRGVGEGAGVEGDMDRGFGEVPKLIGAHNYATQEMVNLFLCGVAHSQVFNGERVLEGGDDRTVLRGIPDRTDVGFLTLFEHYEYVEVGSHYKEPRFPIWVICSESHYSVLFSRDPSLTKGELACAQRR